MSEPEELVEALRRVIRAARVADVDQLDSQTIVLDIEALHALAERLEAERVDDERMQISLRLADVQARMAASTDRGLRAAEIGVAGFFPYSPYVGPLNPIAPPIEFELAPGDRWTDVTAEHMFDAAYNGPPGGVHGGVIAGVADELLGAVCVVNDVAGFTGTLTIRYRSLTPVDEPIRMRAWVERVEGRKSFAAATFHWGDTLCAEAEGVFISGAPADILS